MTWPHLTMILAGVACIANLSVLRLEKHPNPLRVAYVVWHVIVGITAGFYAAAYAVLIYTDIDRATWSEALTPASAFVFLTIWTIPALLFCTAHLRPDQ